MKLKDCPFCKSKRTTVAGHGEFVTVNCLSCFACGCQAETEEEAIKLWNKRERKEKTMKQLKTKCYQLAQLKAKLTQTDDNGNGICIYCNTLATWAELNGVHWIPKGNGAATKTSLDPRNIHIGHAMCNNLNDSRKFTMTMHSMFTEKALEELEIGSKNILEREELAEFIKRTREECRELAKKKSFKVNIP